MTRNLLEASMQNYISNASNVTHRTRPRPILMIPLRRCGSHALRLRLNFNPDFYAPYPLHIVDFMPLVGLYGDLKNDHAYFQLIVDVIGLQTASIVKWPDIVFEPEGIFEAIKNEQRSVHRVVWELLLQAGEKRGARVVMDKSLDSVAYADELMSLFDDFIFLNVVRDPRAQISSMNKAIIHDFDCLLNAMTWLKAYETGRRLADTYPDRVMTIRYEDFVADQESVLKKICSFMGINYLPEMLDVSRSQEAQKISVMSALWESNAMPPIPANIDKFRKALSPEEILVIETLAAEYMDYYGYERINAGSYGITESMIATAQKRSEENRKKAWIRLRETNYQDYELRKFRAGYLRSVKERLQEANWTNTPDQTAGRTLHDTAAKLPVMVPPNRNSFPFAGPNDHSTPGNKIVTPEILEQNASTEPNKERHGQ